MQPTNSKASERDGKVRAFLQVTKLCACERSGFNSARRNACTNDRLGQAFNYAKSVLRASLTLVQLAVLVTMVSNHQPTQVAVKVGIVSIRGF